MCQRNSSGIFHENLFFSPIEKCLMSVEYLQENAALCDRASEIQHQILVAQEERKFLWKKYTAMQGNSFMSGNQ